MVLDRVWWIQPLIQLHRLVPSIFTAVRVSVFRLIVNIEVQADEEYTGDEERDEGEEDELLEEARLFELNRELVLLLAQLVTLSLQESIANIIHGFFIFFLINLLTIISNSN